MANTDEKTLMQKIREGLLVPHKPGEEDTEFVDAINALFKEFADDYEEEWERIDDNEEIYQGNHWENSGETMHSANNSTFPKPVTPVITSTIENIKADLSDEFPKAIFHPDAYGTEETAKVLTKVVQQELDVCGFEKSYDRMVQDFLNDGWTPMEVGYDPSLNLGLGGSYIQYVVNKNFMCDPQVSDLQEGRACFKFARRPKDWFLQHYPEHFEYMDAGGSDSVDDDHEDFNATTSPSEKDNFLLIEAWFRLYDPETKKHSVHMVLTAGGQILENSHDEKPEGYFKHGKYPFVIATLFPQKGSSLGLGITDMFKDSQRYSDKLDQILLVNALRASKPRLLVQKGVIDRDDFIDFNKEYIEVEGSPSAVAMWQDIQPLPSYIMNYIMSIRETIKSESGANDQARGETSGGITAASAITALQDMATKRSRLESRAFNYAFKDAVRMLVDVLREFAVVPREVPITVDGKAKKFKFSNENLSKLFKNGTELPVEYFVEIKTARQTRYTMMTHNELWLQMMQTLAGTVDPVIMLEGIEGDEKEDLLDNIRRAQEGGMLRLQQENAQLQQMVAQLQQQLDDQSELVAQSQEILDRDMAQGMGEEMSPEDMMAQQMAMPSEETTEELQGMDVADLAGGFM